MKNKPIAFRLFISTASLFVLFGFTNCSEDDQLSPGEDIPALPPVVVTNGISSITNNSALGGGNVTSEGNSPVTGRGVCWNTATEPTTDNSTTSNGSGTGAFTSNIEGLANQTTYYVRAYAINNYGTSYGAEVSFTTTTSSTGIAPAVSTNSVTNITDSTAVCGGNVSNPGSSAVIKFGVCWSTLSNPTILDNYSNDGTGIGSFTSFLTGLSANTTYFVRAYATNSDGTGYGGEVAFNTSGTGTSGNPCPGLPFVTDQRDGQIYPTVLIGNQCWLYKNINFVLDSSWCYDNNAANGQIYGRLYTWESALVACPEGWHLPSNSEWNTLITIVGSDAGGKLKEEGTAHWIAPNTGATNESGFSALPGGFRNDGGLYYSLGARAGFWTSTEKAPSSPLAWYTYLVNYNTTAYNMDNNKRYAFSVRCLKD